MRNTGAAQFEDLAVGLDEQIRRAIAFDIGHENAIRLVERQRNQLGRAKAAVPVSEEYLKQW